jgi:hypothetical protein
MQGWLQIAGNSWQMAQLTYLRLGLTPIAIVDTIQDDVDWQQV